MQQPAPLTAEQDHRRTLDLLGIAALRPGVSGKRDAPNAANYDEAKANPFAALPDPLRLDNGDPVTTADVWRDRRRGEIVEAFDREVYGRVPADVPDVTWEVTGNKNSKIGETTVVVRDLIGRVPGSPVAVEIRATLTIPADATGRVPIVMELSGGPPVTSATRPAATRPVTTQPAGPTWQQQVIARQWGFAVLNCASVQADTGAGLTQGVIGLCNRGRPRGLDDWGTLRAWAWGASRLIDHLKTDASVDGDRIAVAGHSRFGKAALVAMAYEPRLSVAYISSSGAGGVALYRRNWGERLENVAGDREYHWMAGNFLKYAGPLTANDLPVDSHQLVALCAPRAVFVGGGATQGDGWVDARGMFMATAAAGPVYALFGKRPLSSDVLPPIGTALIDGDLAFRQHTGGHTPGPNWPTFLDFAARHFNVSPPPARQP